MLLKLREIPSDDNSSYSWLVPLCLGVHLDVHLGIMDVAGLAGLPDQGLVMCFEQSEFEVCESKMLIWALQAWASMIMPMILRTSIMEHKL